MKGFSEEVTSVYKGMKKRSLLDRNLGEVERKHLEKEQWEMACVK